MAKAQNCGTLAKEAGLTSTISSTSHPIKGSPTTRAVVATASSAGSVVRPRSLHAHAFTWGFIICPYFSSAALKDLNIPTTKQMRIKEQCKNSTKHSCSEVKQTKKKKTGTTLNIPLCYMYNIHAFESLILAHCWHHLIVYISILELYKKTYIYTHTFNIWPKNENALTLRHSKM